MSDDPTEKPKKLRLSRDRHPESDDHGSRAAGDAPEKTRADSTGKAKNSDPTAAPQPEPEATETEKSTEKSIEEAPKKAPPPPSEESPEPKSKLKLSDHADNPQTGTDRVERPHPAPDEAASTKNDDPTDSESDHESGHESEPARQSSPLPVEKKSHSILPSVLVVGLLFALLGSAGYGLWRIVFFAEDSSESSSLKSEENGAMTTSGDRDTDTGATIDQGGPKTPVERAKETVEKARPLDVDEESAGETETIARNGDITQDGPETIGPRTESSAEIEATKTAVSKFLAGLHIGGMRQGERPMILVDGRARTVGDTLHAETGLKFDGVRDGKLAFIDQNGIVYLKSF